MVYICFYHTADISI